MLAAFARRKTLSRRNNYAPHMTPPISRVWAHITITLAFFSTEARDLHTACLVRRPPSLRVQGLHALSCYCIGDDAIDGRTLHY